ncbi:MAG TPA: hypothetical protein VI485_19380 [Vicinamibacterales bacterium]|nr:hypothetical protein [Vicinamibacterales bacterium]
MSPHSRLPAPVLCALILLVAGPAATGAQRSAVPRHPPPPAPTAAVHDHVFVGGYFYDPFFGPYPWWHRTAYPLWYFPVFDQRADLRIRIAPEPAEEAAVYVDGFYAGSVDDFNGVFQALPLTPGGHRVIVYLAGYRTIRRNIYMSPGSMFTLHETMQALSAGEFAEPPDVAPPVPPPPPGTYRPPVTAPRAQPTPSAPAMSAVGTLDLRVAPADVEVAIDGQPWATAEEGHFVVQLTVGKHRLELNKTGAFRLGTDIVISEGETNRLELTLKATR